jgi:hypothetical protein
VGFFAPGSGDVSEQEQTFPPVTIIQEEADVESEPFFPEGGSEAAFRKQGYIGSGATRRHVTIGA